MRRRLLLLAGGVALAVGLALWLLPGPALGAGQALVTAVGLLALVQAVRLGRARYRGDLRWAATPDPELPGATPSPGDDVGAVLSGFAGEAAHGVRTRTRDGLESVAVAALTAYAGYGPAEARDRVERGVWTDDAYAAAFLGDATAPEPTVRERLARLVGDRSAFDRDLKHTVDAIAETARLSPSESDDVSDPGDRPRTVEDGERAERETGRWRGVGAAALFCLGVGAVTETPAVVLTGVVGLGYGAYARSRSYSPETAALSVEREVSDESPDPGDEVRVTVTVRNEGDGTLPDLRLVDGVPEALPVAEGSPRFGTALRPGGEAAFSYAVTARRGDHEFGPTLALAYDLTGGIERERRLPAATTLTCVPRLRATEAPVPLRQHVTQFTGRVSAATGGDGVEFHATREYRSGDPLSRVDWNRRARTGEFSTLEFREERSATVVLVVDSREAAHVSPAPGAPSAVDRSVDAAGRLFASLSDAGNRVGVAALGNRDCWLPPGSGVDHRSQARDLLARHAAFRPVPTPSAAETETRVALWERQFRRRLSGDTQLVFLTPLADDVVARTARQFQAYGYPVTVVSPDPGADRTPGHRLSRVVRQLRVTDLRRAGVRVVDWDWVEPLDVACSRYTGEWS